MASLLNDYAYLTPDLPGTGGIVKRWPSDFIVEETPFDGQTGDGDYLHIYIQKTGLTTHDAVQRIAKAFHISKRELSWAGLKDKHAITRQLISVHLPEAEDAAIQRAKEFAERPGDLGILWTERHTECIKRGQHGGNRFIIRVREVNPTCAIKAQPIMDVLEKNGVPNFVGEQRFGFRQNSHLLGRWLIRRDHEAFFKELLEAGSELDSRDVAEGRELYRQGKLLEAMKVWPKALRFDRQALDAMRSGFSPADAIKHVDQKQLNFLVSAMQSHVFNEVLNRRLEHGTLNQILPGDVPLELPSRSIIRPPERAEGPYACVEPSEIEALNAPNGPMAGMQATPSGPMWGPNMPKAEHEPLVEEQAALAAFDVNEADLYDREDLKIEGQRRPMRVALEDPDLASGVDERGPFLKVSFGLPRGSYATVALREICKTDLHPPTRIAKTRNEPSSA